MRYIYDDFLPKKEFKALADAITGPAFPWFARIGAAKTDSKNDTNVAFSNTLYWISPQGREFELCVPIIEKLELLALLRLKANLDLKNPSGKILEPEAFHTDIDIHGPEIWTMILYLNDCNGATMFEEDKAPIKSKANRAIIFSSDLRHSGCHQTDTPFRYLLNLNFLAKKLPDGGKEF